MANNTNNGGASGMYLYSENPGHQTTTDEEQDKKIVAIVLPVVVVGIFLLRLFCLCVEKARGGHHAGDAARVRQPRQMSSEAGGWAADRAPSSLPVAAGAAVEVAPELAREPPLVCTYRKADGWQEASCGVCLAELADGEVLRVLPACLHYFHAACVGEWLRGHDTCPLCRAPLVAPAAAA